jgi:hypothetical protein
LSGHDFGSDSDAIGKGGKVGVVKVRSVSRREGDLIAPQGSDTVKKLA